MKEAGLLHRKRRPHGITKATTEIQDRENIIKRDFSADAPKKKFLTDITEIQCLDGKLYVSPIMDCFNGEIVALEMRDNMKKELCIDTVKQLKANCRNLNGAILHSDRGSQYTSDNYRNAISKYGLCQSMNSDGGRCHDNARCESMWARLKEEVLYDRYDTKWMTTDEVKVIVWRYFMSYWNNRRICSAIGGMSPATKRQLYYSKIKAVA